jgi:acylglycerol lipase
MGSVVKLDVDRARSEFRGPHELVRTSDGKILFLRRWEASGPSKVSVLVLHGITAHSGAYGPLLGEPLSRAGFTVYGLDLRGHGLSDGKRGDYPGHHRWEKDLAEALQVVRSRSSKVVVLGHSLGVLSAAVLAKTRPRDVDGLVLLSAATTIRKGVFPPPRGGALLKSLLGAALFRGTPLIEYRREGMGGRDDPLFVFRYSARFYTVLYGTGVLRLSSGLREGRLDSPHLAFDGRLPFPVLVGVGDKDEIFPLEAVQRFYESIPADDKSFFVVPGARHAVFPEGAWRPLIGWLSSKF